MPKCIICFENEAKTFQPNNRCKHKVCKACLAQYLLTYIGTPKTDYSWFPCPEPSCVQRYSADYIATSDIFDENELDTWWKTILERTTFDSKGYCPYLDCGAVFELFGESGGYEEDTYGECYECYRPICFACESQWHPDKLCENKRRRWQRPVPDWMIRPLARENSILVRGLAFQQGWTQCPKCKQMVARSDGCNTMRCRCGTEFCYRCGGASVNHSCKRNCHTMTDDQLKETRKDMFKYPLDVLGASSSSSN